MQDRSYRYFTCLTFNDVRFVVYDDYKAQKFHSSILYCFDHIFIYPSSQTFRCDYYGIRLVFFFLFSKSTYPMFEDDSYFQQMRRHL